MALEKQQSANLSTGRAAGKTRYRVCSVQDVPEGGRLIVTVKNMELGIFHTGGQWYAWRNVCPHAAAPVCEGVVCGTRLPSMVYEYEYGRDREVLRCPWHGWEFDLLTGKHLADESGMKLRGFEVEIDGGEVYVLT
ncbi:Rieske iron-sulfur domain-containing protein [Paenibacillus mucilaginosus 3016]|uniref:Rieske iron-sulfur domain-containing protein n=1 Tax=Paenibacillus mucilaginosus 3016 TaxID=1116391 RepID=H6NCP9_9BACL|nr:Rieske (2Fe-2S) protein [Paenibacillus mucilaginosus]AFC28978.1 Rieske iron-sulfur domain-containing protein [Paenibacillus mucilaginosus 3016]WFA17727.1 Rieske (2Fe-2S) protein [Paenibacillus mucilaginosus]